MRERRLLTAVMPRLRHPLLAVLLVVSAFGVAPTVGHAAAAGSANLTLPDAPGARLAGVVGVGRAEFAGELDVRSADAALARAHSPDAKAAVVADQLSRADGRLSTLEARKAALAKAHANGSLDDATYRASTAVLAAEIGSTQRVLNHTAAAADGLSSDVLAAHGVNATAIDALQHRARVLGGGDVADIARSIAGPGVGQSLDRPAERPTNRGGASHDGRGSAANGTSTVTPRR